jgi:hypothetical protein
MAEDKRTISFADNKIKDFQNKILETKKGGFEKQQEILANIKDANVVGQNFVPNKSESSVPVTPDIPTASKTNLSQTTVQTTKTPQIQNKDNTVIKNLRTFQGDVADILKNQNTSVLDIALAEKKRQQEIAKVAPPKNPESKKKVIIIVISVLLIIAGTGAIAGFFVLQKKTPAPVLVEMKNQAIIASNSKFSLIVDKADKESLFSAINKERDESVIAPNEILNLEMVKNSALGKQEPIDTNTLFTIINSQAPGSLLRAFSNEFMFGFYKSNNNEPFLIIRLDSFDNAWNGMLNWEKNMNEDIGAILAKKLLSSTETNQVENQGTSTIKQTKKVGYDSAVNATFEDITIKNKDARILKNPQGETILLYSFLDKQTLLITSSEVVLENLIDKLAASKLVH